MQEPSRVRPGEVIAFPCFGCLVAGCLLGATGAIIGFYFPLALILGGLAGITVGGWIGARGHPRVRTAFALSAMSMTAITVVISFNHNGPDPVLYLLGDAGGAAAGIATAFLYKRNADRSTDT